METPGFPPLSDSSDVSGTLDADVSFSGGLPSMIEFLPTSDLGFTDVLITVSVGGSTVEVARTENVRGTVTSGPLSVDAAGNIDLTGSVLTLDEGLVGFLGDDPSNNELSGNPIVLVLDAGSTGTLTSNDLGGGLRELVLSSDIVFTGRVDENPIIDLTVSGTLVARGTVAIPEPTAFAGLAAGLCVMSLRRRRAVGRR